MKIHLTLVALALGAAPLWAQNPAPQTPPAKPQSAPSSPVSPAQTTPAKIDPEKEAAIRRLPEVSGAKAAANQTVTGMMENMKPLLLQSLPPGEYREKLLGLFFEKFKTKLDVQQLVDLAIPIYDKYFTLEEINSLRQYYQTPIGQKILMVLPKVVTEMQSQGMKLGQKLGQESMREVLNEHPDMMQALQEADKASKPQ